MNTNKKTDYELLLKKSRWYCIFRNSRAACWRRLFQMW